MSILSVETARSRIKHLPGLTGLRGVAAWWVVLYHFRDYFPPGLPDWTQRVMERGYLAVDLFFVLSGFVIAHNYLDGFRHVSRTGYLRFLGIRIARIYPLHIFILALFLLNPLAIALAANQGVDMSRYGPGYYLLSILLLQNWGFTSHLAWNIPAWSISTEWFVYLLFPAIAWVAHRIRGSTLACLAGVLVSLIVLGLGLMQFRDDLGGDIASNGLLRCVCEFSAGVALYLLWLRGGERRSYSMIAAAVIAIFVSLFVVTGDYDFWFMPIAWAALIFLIASGGNPFSALVSSKAAELIGEWSYATYLAHYFIRDWVKFLLVGKPLPAFVPGLAYLTITAIASIALYRTIEVPGRRALRRIVSRLTEVRPARS